MESTVPWTSIYHNGPSASSQSRQPPNLPIPGPALPPQAVFNPRSDLTPGDEYEMQKTFCSIGLLNRAGHGSEAGKGVGSGGGGAGRWGPWELLWFLEWTPPILDPLELVFSFQQIMFCFISSRRASTPGGVSFERFILAWFRPPRKKTKNIWTNCDRKCHGPGPGPAQAGPLPLRGPGPQPAPKNVEEYKKYGITFKIMWLGTFTWFSYELVFPPQTLPSPTPSPVPSRGPQCKTVISEFMDVLECVIIHPGRTLQLSPLQSIWQSQREPPWNSVLGAYLEVKLC